MAKVLKETEEAIQFWLSQVNPPEVARDTIRKKMLRLKLTPEEIRQDCQAKMARFSK